MAFDLLANKFDLETASLLPRLRLTGLQQRIAQQARQRQGAALGAEVENRTAQRAFRSVSEFSISKSQGNINFTRFSERYIISGSSDNTCKLLDIQLAKAENQDKGRERRGAAAQADAAARNPRRTYYGHIGSVNDACISKTHDLLVSGSDDTEMRFYNLQKQETEALVHADSMGQPVQSLDFLSSSQLAVAASSPFAYVYDLA